MKNITLAFSALVVVLVSCASAVCRAEGKAPPREDRTLECGTLWNGVGPFDYRDRDENQLRQWMMKDTKANHLDPALRRIHEGESSAMVMKDLDFLLREFPNHYPALEALIEYDLAGGKPFGFRSTDCYFDRARRFAPDDPMVVLAEGYFFWKKGKKERAEQSYQEALDAWPTSGDVNYNFGLFCFDIGKRQKALELARVAYAMNYPLPGLRIKLERAGLWQPLPAESAAESAASPSATAPDTLASGR